MQRIFLKAGHASGMIKKVHISAIRRWNPSKQHANLKLVSAIFFLKIIFHQMIAPQKLWKMFFISSKKLFSLKIFKFLYFHFPPLFLPVSHCLRAWSKINLKVHDAINCLNKNSITHFVWYLEKERRYDIETLVIDTVLNKEHFCRKIMRKMCTKN